MKSFNEYVTEDKKKREKEYTPIETVFGCHSLKNPPEKCPAQPDAEIITTIPIQEKLERVLDRNKLHDELANHYKHDEHSTEHLYNYTSHSSNLNRHLHKAAAANEDPHEFEKGWDTKGAYTDHIRGLDAALKKHKTPKPFNVYTGVHSEHDLHKIGHDQGSNVHHPIRVQHHAYLSTSIDKDQAKFFAHTKEHVERKTHEDGQEHTHVHQHKHVIKIHVPAGHHGAYVDHISRHQGEKEFILPRGTKLHIHHKPVTETHSEDFHITHYHRHDHIWHARIVKDHE